MQALGCYDQFGVALCVGLPALAFPCRLTDAFAGTPELRQAVRVAGTDPNGLEG
jgi:hypothetical protein